MSRDRFRPLALPAVALLLVLGAACATVGGGRINAFEGVQVGPPDHACTSSEEFEEMPGMSLPFELSDGGQVVVLFQGQFGGFQATPGARTVLRFTIDGGTVGSAVAIANDHGNAAETFGFNSFSGELNSGPHTAKVLWHVFPAGETTCVEERSLIVLRP